MAKYTIEKLLAKATQFHTDEDYPSAFKWYLHAAKKGNAEAMFKIAEIYKNGEIGEGYEKDPRHWSLRADHVKAYEWYEKAANAGSIIAIRVLADINMYGDHKETNYPEAIKWLLIAADLEDAQSMFELGYLYYDGLFEIDLAKTKYWFERAANLDYPPAIRMLKELILDK